MVFTSTTNVLRTQWCLQVRMYGINGVQVTHVPRTQWYLQVLRMNGVYLELNGVYKYYECISMVFTVLRMYLELNSVYKYYECT